MRSINGKRQVGSSRELIPQSGEDLRRYTQNKRADRPKVSIREALLILRKMASGTGTIDSLERATRVSRATVYRLLADCEEELGVRFDYHGGTYSVKDWGLLSRRRVLEEGNWPVAHASHRKGTFP
jgi:hypothetical protein